MGKKILVVGGVALGPKAGARARRRDPEAEITIVDMGDIFSYAGCGMPFYIEGQITEIDELLCTSFGVRRDEAYFNNVKDIKLLGHTEALRINRADKTVTVRDLRPVAFGTSLMIIWFLASGQTQLCHQSRGLTSKASTGFTTRTTRFQSGSS